MAMTSGDFCFDSTGTYPAGIDPSASSGLVWFKSGNGTNGFNTLGLRGVSISIRKVSGTINGQFKIQTADFGADQGHLPAAGDWVDYPGAVYPSAAGAITGTNQIQVWALTSKWVRVVFTDNSSSSPLIDYAITGRGQYT